MHQEVQLNPIQKAEYSCLLSNKKNRKKEVISLGKIDLLFFMRVNQDAWGMNKNRLTLEKKAAPS